MRPVQRSQKPQPELPMELQQVNLHAAGIDIGATSHFVAVPSSGDPQPVREFGAFTRDLHQLADWLQSCGVETVAILPVGEGPASTGFPSSRCWNSGVSR